MKIKKLLLPIIALAIMVALGACSNEELMTDANPDAKPHTGRTLSFTAAMPGEDVATRVGLTQEADKSITLTWQADDELQLAFVQGATKATNIATIASMTADKKKATFEIEIPAEIDLAAVFNLYGVYGAGTIDITGTNPIVTLPTDPGSAESLTDVQNRKDVMLSFQSLSVDINGEPISVLFTHLGSLFSITVKNSSTESLEGLYTASLRGINNSDNQNWAYNSGASGQTYDLVNNEFLNPVSASNFIAFTPAKNSIPVNETVTFWGWYPPLPGVHWPELEIGLSVSSGGSPALLAGRNTLPARTSETAAGKSYYFYAAWDGAELNFTNESFTNELTIDVAEMGALSNLLSATQKFNTTKLTLTGQINKADYDVMRSQMPSLKHVDLSKVISYEGTVKNKIPDSAFGDSNFLQANSTITTIVLPESTTAIGNHAFRNCYSLTGSLILPDDVTEIGNFAFNMCKFTGDLILPEGLTTIQNSAFNHSGFNGSLTIPASVVSIGKSAFSDCQFTGDLILPEGLTIIENAAFNRCDKITGTVIFPSKLTSIGTSGFNGCTGVEAFQFPHTSPIAYTEVMLQGGKTVIVPTADAVATYKAADGWKNHPIVGLYDEFTVDVPTKGTLSTILTSEQKANIRKLTVTGQIDKADYDVMKNEMPNLRVVDLSKVTSYEGDTENKIPDGAFGGENHYKANSELSSITLPESVTIIGNSAFGNCVGLTGNLILPAALTSIEKNAFINCENLTGKLILPATLISIGEFAFNRCGGFTGDLIIPENLTAIENSVFSKCTGFRGSLILPAGLETIGSFAFNQCKISGTVVFPISVSSIGRGAFDLCDNVNVFRFPHTTAIPYTYEMLANRKTVEVISSAAPQYLDNAAGWVPRHTIRAYVEVEVEVPPL